MCIRDSFIKSDRIGKLSSSKRIVASCYTVEEAAAKGAAYAVSYTHLRAHETPEHLVCRLLLEKKNTTPINDKTHILKSHHSS